MISSELLKQVQELDRADKLRLIQLLAGDLAQAESTALLDGATYESWSPFDAPEAANTLLQMLEDDKALPQAD